jgi:hypothetical protein
MAMQLALPPPLQHTCDPLKDWQSPLVELQHSPDGQSAVVVQVPCAVARPEESRFAPTAPNRTPALRRSAFRRDTGVAQMRVNSSKRLPSPISTSDAAPRHNIERRAWR